MDEIKSVNRKGFPITCYKIKYKCGFCSHRFSKEVRKGQGQGKKQNWSSMVKCPACGNFLKTWE